MRLLAALAAVFKVLPGEGRLLLLLMAESFCLGLSRLFTQTASGVLFLVNFDVRDLPYVYIAVAITVPLIGAAYARLESRLPLPRLLVANLGSLLLVLAVLAISLALTDARWPAFALAVWYEAIWAMTSLALWGLAGRMFNVRQGKRLFALISAGDVVAATVGGFLTPVLVSVFGIGSLLVGAVGGLVGALYIVAYITRAFGGSLAATDEDPPADARSAPSSSLYRRYVMMIIGLVVVSHASFYFIDNIFYNQVEARYADETQLASFLGVFWAIVNLLMLLSNLFVVSRVVGRYGVQAGLLVLPAVTALVTVTLLVGGAFLALPSFVFALAVLNNLLDWTLRESIYKSSLLILYQPLPAARRFQTQALSESMAQPVAQGLAGLALLGLGLLGFGVLQTNVLLLVMLVASILLAWPLGHRYAAVVMHALNRRSLSGAPVWQPAGRHAMGSGQPALLDGAAVALVRHEVANPHPSIAIYVLNVLEEMEHPSLVDAFGQALEHPSPVVRHEALRRLERRGAHRGRTPSAGVLPRSRTPRCVGQRCARWRCSVRTRPSNTSSRILRTRICRCGKEPWPAFSGVGISQACRSCASSSTGCSTRLKARNARPPHGCWARPAEPWSISPCAGCWSTR